MASGPEKRKVISMSAVDSEAELERQEKRKCNRAYIRSSPRRLRWTGELHMSFMGEVDALGGRRKATLKRILELMNRGDVTIMHVQSNLQMYRMNKINAEEMPLESADQVLLYPIWTTLSRGSHVELSQRD